MSADYLLTKSEVAERLRCSKRTVERLAASGHLEAVPIGSAVRFRSESVDAFTGRCPVEKNQADIIKSAVSEAFAPLTEMIAAQREFYEAKLAERQKAIDAISGPGGAQ